MSQIMQRQSIHYSGNTSVLRHIISQVAGLLESIEGDKKMRAFGTVDITIEQKVVILEVCSGLPLSKSNNHVLCHFQWVANPVNDMYADTIVAAILQADLLEGPIKNLTTSAKVDRMHFKVCL